MEGALRRGGSAGSGSGGGIAEVERRGGSTGSGGGIVEADFESGRPGADTSASLEEASLPRR